MQIIVIGIGGVGGYFGGRLTLTDHRVEFVARGEHGRKIETSGLQVESINGDFTARPDKVHASLDTVKEADLILICTKSWQLDQIGRELKDRIGPDTLVLPLQNGVNSVEILTRHLPSEQVLGGLCKIISKKQSPGVVRHFAFHPQVIFGEVDGRLSDRGRAVKQVFEEAGIDTRFSEDIRLDVWRKFLFICVLSGMGAVTRQEVGVMREDPGVRELMMASAEEILALAQEKGVRLSEEDVENTFKAIDKQEPHSTSSVQRDLMGGRPSEIHDFNGYVVKEAQRLGLEVPVNKFIYYCLRPMEAQARKEI